VYFYRIVGISTLVLCPKSPFLNQNPPINNPSDILSALPKSLFNCESIATILRMQSELLDPKYLETKQRSRKNYPSRVSVVI